MKKSQVVEPKISYSVQEVLNTEKISIGVLTDLKKYVELLDVLASTACKNTHYEKLDQWSKPAYGFIHDMLTKYEFINGGKKQNDEASFWWKIYAVISSVCYSPNLKTSTANHHASAFERNEALSADIKIIVDHFSK